jgi:hypothetical protein
VREKEGEKREREREKEREIERAKSRREICTQIHIHSHKCAHAHTHIHTHTHTHAYVKTHNTSAANSQSCQAGEIGEGAAGDERHLVVVKVPADNNFNQHHAPSHTRQHNHSTTTERFTNAIDACLQ